MPPKTRRTPYDQLSLIPSVIAGVVVGEAYTGCHADRVEPLRDRLTPDERLAFVDAVDQRCRAAYECRAAWFDKIIKSRTNAGRDQLYVWVRHWLAGYVVGDRELRTR